MSTEFLPRSPWAAGTNQNSIPANDNSLRSELMERPWLGVENSPPTTADGDVYIVGDTPSGAFSTFSENDVAIYRGGTWKAWAPFTGMRGVVSSVRKVFDGSDWINDPSVSGGGSGAVDSVNGQTGDVVLDAEDIGYDNSGSGLSATDVQGAIDEIAGGGGGGGAAIKLLKGYGSGDMISSDGVFINTSASNRRARGIRGRDSGKYYFAVRVNGTGALPSLSIGLIQQDSTDTHIGTTGSMATTRLASWGLISSAGTWTKYHGSTGSFSGSPTNGDVILVYVDFGAGFIWWEINGTVPAGGDPATGANPHFSDITALCFPAGSGAYSGSANSELEFDLESSTPFGFTPASGFSPWGV